MTCFEWNQYFLAALVALKPTSYFLRLGLAVVAFGAATNTDKVVTRAVGFAWLLITGVGLLIVGLSNGTIIDMIFGLIVFGSAAFAWWFTRH